MSKFTLIVEYRGIRKDSPRSIAIAQDAALRVWPSGRQVGLWSEIAIDTFYGPKRPRNEELINITFEDSSIWSGTFANLQRKLRSDYRHYLNKSDV